MVVDALIFNLININIITDNFLGACGCGGDFGDGNGAGVSGDDTMRFYNGFDFFNNLVLDVNVFKYCFNHNISVSERIVLEGGVQTGQVLVSFKAEKENLQHV